MELATALRFLKEGLVIMTKLLHFRNWLYKHRNYVCENPMKDYEAVDEVIDYFEDHYAIEISLACAEEEDEDD